MSQNCDNRSMHLIDDMWMRKRNEAGAHGK